MLQGCTQYFKDSLAKKQEQWIRGKIFGSSYLYPKYNFLPIWSIGTWKSVCITISSATDSFRVNINGHNVLQTENVLKTSKASFDFDLK